MSTVWPREEVKPPKNAYPPWLAAQLRGENVAVPQSVIDKYYPKIEPSRPSPPPKIHGDHGEVPAKYVPPPIVVQQRPKILVKFKVLSVSDRPIFGFSIRANDEDLTTDAKGEAQIIVYQGHDFTWSTGRESGWSIPVGAKRRLRMVGMVPIAQTFPIGASTTILIFPESGEYKFNGQNYAQTITYATS